MRTYRNSLLCAFLLLTVTASQALSVAFEERKPRDEEAILVPKGARPTLKEEYPRGQLVVDRIRARHRHTLVIPFFRSWNTAAFTALTGADEAAMQNNPELGNDYELGFALHSQRLRVGALRNKEYFQKEAEGFPEGWYWPLLSMDHADRPKGYMTTSFVHLAARRSRRRYEVSSDEIYRDFNDRVNAVLNVIMKQNRQLTLTARRDMPHLSAEGASSQPGVRNHASISYKMPGEGTERLEILGSSTWSTLTDSVPRDLQYVSGLGSAVWCRNLRPGFDVEAKASSRILNLRDRTDHSNIETLETRGTGWLELSNIFSPAELLKLKLKLSALYDSDYDGFFTPGVELVLGQRTIKVGAGLRRPVILPDHDELYWPSKLIKANDNLRPEQFWEAYGSFSLNIIARLTLLAEASYSRPKSRITWKQLPGHIWTPVNEETTQAIAGDTSLTLSVTRNLSASAGLRYQNLDNQMFEPEIAATGGISYGNMARGLISLGASFWNFQPLEITEPTENLTFVYGRITKRIRSVFSIFIDGRYTFDREDIVYYRGMPQAGRIVSFGANIVFGGLD